MPILCVKCNQSYLREARESHENDDCPEGNIQCVECSIEVKRSEYVSHNCLKTMANIIKNQKERIDQLEAMNFVFEDRFTQMQQRYEDTIFKVSSQLQEGFMELKQENEYLNSQLEQSRLQLSEF